MKGARPSTSAWSATTRKSSGRRVVALLLVHLLGLGVEVLGAREGEYRQREAGSNQTREGRSAELCSIDHRGTFPIFNVQFGWSKGITKAQSILSNNLFR